MSLKEKLRQLKQRISRRLTDTEKAEMKREFSAFMDEHPLPQTVAMPQHTRPPFWVAWHPSYGAIGFVTAMLFTVGISEFSLPNDSLYMIKTGVNERVMLASTYFSPILYAEAGHTIYTRRLEEAEQLIILERFSSETADTVQHEIEEQAHELNTSIDRAEASGNVSEANHLRKKLNATLTQYDPILDILALRKEVSDPTLIDTLIAEAVEKHIAERKEDALPNAIIEMKQDVMKEYARALLDELETMNQAISRHVAMDDVDAATLLTESIAENLSISNSERDRAEAALAADDPELALEHVQSAITATETALKEMMADNETE